MKRNLIVLELVLFASVFIAKAQTLDKVLSEIEKNNKSIQMQTQYWEAQKLHYRTGLAPYNPAVEYDYLAGSSDQAGNQTEFSVTQVFDFPTAYFKKSKMAKQRVAQAGVQLTAARQDVLLEAKKVCIELVYLNKLHTQLTQRKQITEKLLLDFKTRLDKGEGNILEVHKVQIQLIEIKREYQENISAINQLNQKLTSINGGYEITFLDTVYFVAPVVPPFEQLEKEFEVADPHRKILEQEKIISERSVEVSRSLSLPKIEAGYHYQGILGQRYNGIHAGLSIPLWENNNTVKFQKSKMLFADLELQAHRIVHYHEIKQLYEKYESLKIILAEYREVFLMVNNSGLLSKALAIGQISTIEYFLEVNYFTASFNNFLQAEKEYYEVLADLYKFTL